MVSGIGIGIYLLHVAPYETAWELWEIGELRAVAFELVDDPDNECDDANGGRAEYCLGVDVVGERWRSLR